MKKFTKSITPPFVYRLYERMRYGRTGFVGNYSSFSAAAAQAMGYDALHILEKAKAAALKVKMGQAVADRDTVTFSKPLYSYPVLCALLQVARYQDEVTVVDFGGALGSTYQQCRRFLPADIRLNWQIIEQEHFVACGQEHFSDQELSFHSTVDSVASPDVVVLSSVLQYLPAPYQQLVALASLNAKHIIIDRTPFWEGQGHRVTLQYVPASIYKASYPCWLLSRQEIIRHLPNYDCEDNFVCEEGRLPCYGTGGTCRFEGMRFSLSAQ